VHTDCDDSTKTVNPGATEVCDLVDNDCDVTDQRSSEAPAPPPCDAVP